MRLHTLRIAAICWAIWKARNKLCFEGKLVQSYFYYLLCLRAHELLGKTVLEGRQGDLGGRRQHTMMQIALNLLNKKSKLNKTLLLKDDTNSHQKEWSWHALRMAVLFCAWGLRYCCCLF